MYICIKKNPDGGHAFQNGGRLPDGWAVVPAGMVLPDSFPYVNIETKMVTHPAVIRKVRVEVDGETVEKETVVRPEYTQLEVSYMSAGEKIPVTNECKPTADDAVNVLLGVSEQ
jgi:hypothetical protein